MEVEGSGSKSSPVRSLRSAPVLLRTVYSQAQGGVCTALQLTSSNLGLRENMTSSIKPEAHNVSLRRKSRTEPRPQVTCAKNWRRSDV